MRRKDREVTNIDDILRIVDSAKIMHLGLFDAGFPYVVPLHFGYGYTDKKLVFYFHCAKEGHKLDLIRENPAVCVQLECGVMPISGGDVPCGYGSTFSSVIARGHAQIVTDTTEKTKGIALLMKHQTGRDFEISPKTASTVEIVRIDISELTAKSAQSDPKRMKNNVE